MRKYMLHWAAFILIFIVAYGTIENPWSTRYIDTLKQDGSMSVAKTKDPLQEKIKEAADHYNEPAINAENNQVWKAIPGYNGIRVDEKSSYKKMKKEEMYNPDKLVVKQVAPDIHLNELDPAPIYKGNPEKPMVSLMVNVAWGNSYLKKILKIMDEEHVHATFFLDGTWTKKNPDLAKNIQQGGHEIGNHAYSHPDLKQLASDQIRAQIKKTQDIIASVTDKHPKLFALRAVVIINKRSG